MLGPEGDLVAAALEWALLIMAVAALAADAAHAPDFKLRVVVSKGGVLEGDGRGAVEVRRRPAHLADAWSRPGVLVDIPMEDNHVVQALPHLAAGVDMAAGLARRVAGLHEVAMAGDHEIAWLERL